MAAEDPRSFTFVSAVALIVMKLEEKGKKGGKAGSFAQTNKEPKEKMSQSDLKERRP